MKIEVYFFDGRWWYSRNGQLRPLPESVTNREEAKAEVHKYIEMEETEAEKK